MENKLHDCHFHKLRSFFNRIYFFFHILATAPILYFRASYFFNSSNNHHFFSWVLIFGSEILVLLLWIFKLSYYWRPVTRTVFPENLPEDEQKLPRIDVFICTADPDKEPTFEVMNTVISAMSLDYPAHKLSVYLSDDGASSSVTLNALKHAWVFATWWLPFCKTYNVNPVCPKPFFEHHLQLLLQQSHNTDFIQHANMLKEKYQNFKERVRAWKPTQGDEIASNTSARDHSPFIQVINESSIGDDAATINPENTGMPLLVYLAREKRPSHHHHFKAGALNVLQRVSSVLSNAPYILVLDCDMYCNDSSSARQAMCFYLDPKTNPTLAWIQFPQKFHNINETDIYDSQMITTWPIIYPGTDGIQGPILSGTNFYINRKALYGFTVDGGNDITDQRYTFGSSNELIKSLGQMEKNTDDAMKTRDFSCDYKLQEAQFLATCVYEDDTQWGIQVGFRYNTVVEDVMTGFILHGQGWKSVYLNPARPQFLGSATTSLNEALIQNSRWAAGLLQIGLSKYCPLFYNSPRLLIFQRMLYSWAAFFPIDFLPISCFAIVQPICFFYGIPLYPKVSDLLFMPFAFVFISSRVKLLSEVFISGGSVHTWLNVQRIVMIKGVTCYVYGALECMMTKLGIREANFMPTNKAGDDDTSKWYQIGKYDFRTSNMFLVPIVTAVTLNISSFVAGVTRVIFGTSNSWDTLFAQLCFSFYVLIMSFPVIEGMVLRKDNASIPIRTTLVSTLLSFVVLGLGYFIFVLH
ncbi:hypothetical protein SOVF_076660 [Spinacia oleracea]|nr:hypothetical protein SOVF_076660 [Spinacia oleracea]